MRRPDDARRRTPRRSAERLAAGRRPGRRSGPAHALASAIWRWCRAASWPRPRCRPPVAPVEPAAAARQCLRRLGSRCWRWSMLAAAASPARSDARSRRVWPRSTRRRRCWPGDQTSDMRQAHALAADALDLAQRAAATPASTARWSAQAASKLDAIDRVVRVNPAMAVRLGPSGGNVVDLAVGDDTLYTLDVVEATVRAFRLDGRDQQPTPDTLLVRSRRADRLGQRRLAAPGGDPVPQRPATRAGRAGDRRPGARRGRRSATIAR